MTPTIRAARNSAGDAVVDVVWKVFVAELAMTLTGLASPLLMIAEVILSKSLLEIVYYSCPLFWGWWSWKSVGQLVGTVYEAILIP